MYGIGIVKLTKPGFVVPEITNGYFLFKLPETFF